MTMEELLNDRLYKSHICDIKARTLQRYECATKRHIPLEYKDIDIKSISEILGHSNISTTLNVYVHSLMNYKKSQMQKLKRLI